MTAPTHSSGAGPSRMRWLWVIVCFGILLVIALVAVAIAFAPVGEGDGATATVVATATARPTATPTTTAIPTATPSATTAVACQTWRVTQSVAISSRWLEVAISAGDSAAARQQVLDALHAHHDLLGAAAVVLSAPLGLDPAAVSWRNFADPSGCMNQEGVDAYNDVQALLSSALWRWQPQCIAEVVATGVMPDGDLVRANSGTGSAATQGCYLLQEVESGESPTDPEADITGVLYSAVLRWDGAVMPPQIAAVTGSIPVGQLAQP